ncbi:MAG: hypothetical protein ACP5I4_00830, partial [Oceanipulchritudo sp.]
MSLIIHKVLFEKLETHPEWRQFEATYRTLSGHAVRLLEEQPAGGRQLWAKIDVRGVLVGVLVADGTKPGGAKEKACRHLLSMATERFASILA